jgi:hypothetical protein
LPWRRLNFLQPVCWSLSQNSFAEHFSHDENDEGAEQTAAGQKIDQGETSGCEHGCH